MAKKISTLSVSDKIEVSVNSDYQSRLGNKIIFVVADKNHAGYPDNSVTLITEKIIQLMCFDAKEPKNTTNKYIKAYGNSRYSYSNILQWLNSSAAGEHGMRLNILMTRHLQIVMLKATGMNIMH